MSTKKDEQRRIKEEKQAATRRRDFVTGWLLKGGAVIVLALTVVVLYDGLVMAPTSLPPAQVSEQDHVRGNADAAVTLTMYADFQCPACLTESNVIARAWPQISDRVRVVFRYYPLDTHRHAFLAARYAEAAALQDAFWPMHDALFANQTLWSGVEDAAAQFDSYANALGLDLEKLKQDVESPQVRDKILADQRGGTRAGVRATPSLFINGRMLQRNPGSVGELVKLIDDAAALLSAQPRE
jgi:protein-disulfide isomerase